MQSLPSVKVMMYKVLLEFDTSYFALWKDVIKSIDIFLSPGLGYNLVLNIIDNIPSNITQDVWLLKRPILYDTKHGGL
jgi:hypothetical protein